MKKFFTLVGLALAMTVNAQVECMDFDVSALGDGTEADAADPKDLGSTSTVKATLPFKDDENAGKGYKAGSIACDGEEYVVISNDAKEKFFIGKNGATGNGNPRTEVDGKTSISFAYPYTTPKRGMVLQLAVGEASWSYATMVVTAKLGDNKNYLVYENGNAIPYTIIIGSKDFEGSMKNYNLTEDDLKGSTGVITGGLLKDGTSCPMIIDKYGFEAAKKNGVAVIIFNVIPNRTYQVCGLGTKIATSGFCLMPEDYPETIEVLRAEATEGGDKTQLDSYFLMKDYEPTEGGYEAYQTKLDEATAVAGVAKAAKAAKKAVKVAENGQIVIGNANIAGQLVK